MGVWIDEKCIWVCDWSISLKRIPGFHRWFVMIACVVGCYATRSLVLEQVIHSRAHLLSLRIEVLFARQQLSARTSDNRFIHLFW